MNKNINSLRTTANNLTTLLCMQIKKKKVTKPGALIPGAASAAGFAMTLDTKGNSADIVVQKDNKEIQRATFNYKETPDGYEMVSAESAYMYDDEDNKEIRQNYYLIEPNGEKVFENTINYTDAPIKTTTRKHIDKINSAIAQASGYKSSKTDYDPQESHTYGKKSLQRDIPSLSQLLEIISPDSKFVLRIKDKLKKDNKTSLVAFEASDTENGNKVVRGFMSANGDSVSYHIDTDDMTIVGEQSSNIKLSRAYLKPERTSAQQEEVKSDSPAEAKTDDRPKANTPKPKAKVGRKPKATPLNSEAKTDDRPKANTPQMADIKKDEKPEITNKATTKEQKTQTKIVKSNHNCSADYYRSLILDIVANKNLSTKEKIRTYKKVLALAYIDSYNRDELMDILSFFPFSTDCKTQYVNAGIKMAEGGDIQAPVRTTDDKINELQNIELDIDDEHLKVCIQNLTSKKEIAKIQDDAQKENFVNTALNILKNSSSKDFISDLLSFIQQASEINEDLNLHYEIYMESVNNKKVNELRTNVGELINKIPDNLHETRDAFILQWCAAINVDQLEELQKAIQDFLYSEQPAAQNIAESPKEKKQPKLTIKSLHRQNQKLVKEILTWKNAQKRSLSFSDAKNLLLDIGFTNEDDGVVCKFIPPIDLFFNGEKQPFISISHKSNTLDKGAIADIVKICKQYYRNEIN